MVRIGFSFRLSADQTQFQAHVVSPVPLTAESFCEALETYLKELRGRVEQATQIEEDLKKDGKLVRFSEWKKDNV